MFKVSIFLILKYFTVIKIVCVCVCVCVCVREREREREGEREKCDKARIIFEMIPEYFSTDVI